MFWIPFPFMLFGTRCRPDTYQNRKSLVTSCVIMLVTKILDLIFLPLARYSLKLMGPPPRCNEAFRHLMIRNSIEFCLFIYFNGLLSRFAKRKLR